MGYAGIDTANRVFAGQPVVSQGLGYQAVDKDNNLPAKGPYREARTIEDTYLKLWGVG
jgi:ribose transport system substrate-binding protein